MLSPRSHSMTAWVKHPLSVFLVFVMGLLCLQNPHPALQIAGGVAVLWGGVGILDTLLQLWRRWHADQQRIHEEAVQKEKQEARHARDLEEREQRREQREKTAQITAKNRERAEASQRRQHTEMTMMAAAREQRESLLEAEAVRLMSLSTEAQHTEIAQMLSRVPFPLSEPTTFEEGTLWEVRPREERVLLFLWESQTPLSKARLENLEALREDRGARRLYLLCFAGFGREVVEAVPTLPVTLVEPHLLAYWTLEGIKI